MNIFRSRKPADSDDDANVVRVTLTEIISRAALSSDGTRLAIASMRDVSGPNTIREYLVPDVSAPHRQYTVDGPWISDVLYAGDTLLARVEEFMGWTTLVRRTEEGLEAFARGFEVSGLTPTRDGYVGLLRSGTGLAFGTAHGDGLRGVSLAHDLKPRLNWSNLSSIDTEPTTNLVAVTGEGLAVLNGDGTELIARTELRDGRIGKAVFVGPDRLVAETGDGLATWRLTGTDLMYEGRTHANLMNNRLVAAPSCHLVIALPQQPKQRRAGPLRGYDAATLQTVDLPTRALRSLDKATHLERTHNTENVVLLQQLRHPEYSDTVELHPLDRAGRLSAHQE